MLELLEHHEDDLIDDALVVVTRSRIRVRRSSADR